MDVGFKATEIASRAGRGGGPLDGRIRGRAQAPAGASIGERRRRPGWRIRGSGLAASGVAFLLTLLAIQGGIIDVWPVNGADSANELIALTNSARQRSGLLAISRDSRLDAVASARSQDMLDRN